LKVICEVCKPVNNEAGEIEMDLIWSYQTGSCESGCCESYVKMYQCVHCKTVKVIER
jgi:hypothetical protein